MENYSDLDSIEAKQQIKKREEEIQRIKYYQRKKNLEKRGITSSLETSPKTVRERIRLYEQLIQRNTEQANSSSLTQNSQGPKKHLHLPTYNNGKQVKPPSNHKVSSCENQHQDQKPMQKITCNKQYLDEIKKGTTCDSNSLRRFPKKQEAINKGTLYEQTMIANIVLQLVNNNKINDFYISSNDERFGSFDDVVIKLDTDEGIKVKAIQLKHRGRNLTTMNLKQKKGDFSIFKYFESFQNIQKKPQECIVFTISKFEVSENTEFQIDGQQFNIKPVKVPNSDKNLKFGDNEYYYKFEIKENEWTHKNSSKVEEYKAFFKRFCLYTNQTKVEALQKFTTDRFVEMFSSNERTFQRYFKVISDWYMRTRNLECLNKKWMQRAIALHVLYPHMKPLSFGPVSEKMKILQTAICEFDITLFKKNDCYSLEGKKQHNTNETFKKLSVDPTKDNFDIKEVNKLRQNYSLSSDYIEDVKHIKDGIMFEQLLWLMNKCPLILKEHEDLEKVIKLCPCGKYILLGEGRRRPWMQSYSVFENLHDLKIKSQSTFKELMNVYTISLQGKKECSLMTAFGTENNFFQHVATTDLLYMSDQGPLHIDGQKVALPEPYIERQLSLNIIDSKYLESVSGNVIVILNCEDNPEVKELKGYQLVNVDTVLGKVDKKFAEGTVYKCKHKYSQSEFQEICRKVPNSRTVHYFKFLNDKSLEWLRSEGDVTDLHNYKLPNRFNEQELWSFKSASSINVISSDPGMGKTELTNSLKNNCPENYWSVILHPHHVNVIFKDSERYETLHNKRLLENCPLPEKFDSLTTFEQEFFKVCLKQNRVVYVWDALDKILTKNLEAVSSLILALSRKDLIQWITSRRHLTSFLEMKFSVLAMSINQFTEAEQADYIKKRLAPLNINDDIQVTISKIKETFLFVEHIDILGIPLQIFMLTEIIRQNKINYLALLDGIFLLTDLYQYFIQEKFNIFFKSKQYFNLEISDLTRLLKKEMKRTLKHYERLALTAVFPEDFTKHLNIEFKKCVEKINDDFASIGLITELQDNVPQFLHGSFAEYFAALYCSKNTDAIPEDFFDQKYNNIRFFFDMLLAKDSPAHTAILYKKFNLLNTCNIHDLTRKDNGSRSALHLISSWGRKYPRLPVSSTSQRYIIEEDKTFNGTLETEEYFTAMGLLINNCNIFEEDGLHKMTPLSYARQSNSLGAEIRLLQTRKLTLEKPYSHVDRINLLYYSALLGYHELIELCLPRKAIQVNEINFITADFHRSPLMLASANGHETFVECLLKYGIDTNQTNNTGRTSLYVASRNGHEKTVECLVKYKSKIDRADRYGRTPLYVASLNGNVNIVELLAKSGAKINYADQYEETPLYVATKGNHYETVECLVKWGADVNHKNNDDWTPLHAASYKGLEEVVECLVKAKAKMDLPNKNGETPLYIASKNNHKNVVELLVKGRAEINGADQLGWTPLHVACSNGNPKIVEFLVKSGADINRADHYGRTPLYRAIQKKDSSVIEFLEANSAKQ